MHSGKAPLSLEMHLSDAAVDYSSVSWTPSQVCGLSTPPPHATGQRINFVVNVLIMLTCTVTPKSTSFGRLLLKMHI